MKNLKNVIAMKKLSIIFLLCVTCIQLFAVVPVIPLPQKYSEQRGSFKFNEETALMLTAGSAELQSVFDWWKDFMEENYGINLKSVEGKRTANIIQCTLEPTIKDDAGYQLKVSRSVIRIVAKKPIGVFYAFQTLRQLLPAQCTEGNQSISIPCVKIEDHPAFSYRGLMLDVSRHFISKEELKRYIDLMAFHKLNVLHWHLTDDQGWRLEIKKYPKLTKVGSVRPKTIIGHMWNKPTDWDTEAYGGYYTQEDIREIVSYAQKRYVEIIPEIEMPGHCVAALAAYPEYSCSGGPFEVEGRWGVFNDIYCTKESTFQFLQDVLDEVVDLFPSKYIHLGGDESPRVRWENCVNCQRRMKEEGLKTEAELQTYFMNRIESYLSTKGKCIIGWDEILEGGIPQRATVMSWRGEKGGIQAARKGYHVIMSPNSCMYLNKHQLNPKTEKIGIRQCLYLKHVYSYHPVPSVLNAKEASYILGVQANLWTEYLVNRTQIDYCLFPRLGAVAEIGWTEQSKKDYDDFCARLKHVKMHYNRLNVEYCRDIYEPK